MSILLTMWLFTCQVRLVNGSLGRVVGFRAPGGGGGGGSGGGGGGGLVGGEEAEVELLPLVEFRGHAGTRSEGKTRRVLLEPERCEIETNRRGLTKPQRQPQPQPQPLPPKA